MSPAARIASFALILGAAFAAAFALGSAFEPADTEAGGGHGEMASGPVEAAGHGGAGGHHGGEVSAYALRLDSSELQPGEARRLSFRIEDSAGATVRHFDELHEREMHLIVIRRDGADFSVAGEDQALAGDLFAPGPFRPQPFPEIAPADRADGYEVRLLTGTIEAGAPSALRFQVSKGGEPVAVEDYLGARGHLVALREGDLAFLHVHPEEGEGAPDEIPYSADFPSAGRYRLYLQFKDGGRVRTAEFTLAVPR